MATTTVEKIQVKQLTKFGFQDAAGVYINWSKNCKDQAKVVPGGAYEIEVYTAESGKKYVNKVLATLAGSAAPAPVVAKASVVAKTEAPKVAPSFGRDFDKEARGKTRCAVFCAALSSPYAAQFANDEDLVKFLHKMVEEGLSVSFKD